MSDNQFKLQINLTKAYKGEGNFAYIEGIASGPEVDLTGERMSLSALQSMVESFKKGIIEFRDAHKAEWNDDLGELVDLYLTDHNHRFYKARIDLNLSGARDLLYRANTLGKKYGVSIGGSIVKAGLEYVADLGKEVFSYFEVTLDEISYTRQAAYQHSFANVVTKSLPKKEEPMSKSEQTEVEKTEVEETNQDTNLTESEAAEQSDATEEAHQDTQTQSEGEEATKHESDEAAADADAETEVSQGAESSEAQTEESTDVDEATEDAAEQAATEEAEATAEDASPAEDVSKALTEAKESAEQLQKALDDSAAKTDELQKSLDAKATELETASQALEETKKSLAEKETELEKRNTRKAIVFGKFDGVELAKAAPKHDQESKTLQRWLNS